MPSIKQTDKVKTEWYKDVHNESIRMGENGDCGVIAIAAAAGVSYKSAHAMCKRFGRRNRKGTPMPL